MRPINRGAIPKKEDGIDLEFKTYSAAKIPLKDRLGSFCSYCEMNIDNQVDIEHVSPKSKNPDLELDWSNFLLGCKACNTIKGNNNQSRDGYVFPDHDNTAFLYDYLTSYVKVDPTLDTNIKSLAQATLDLVQLDRRVDTFNRADDRFYAREQARAKANLALKDYIELISSVPAEKIPFLNRLTANSCNSFFSMWLQIFKDYPEVKRLILQNINGTAMECYDQNIFPINELARS